MQNLPPNLLAPMQFGALKGHDAETLLLTLTQETTSRSHPFGASLDFGKAFDSCDHVTCITLLRQIGIDQGVLRALQAMWASQVRWYTYGGHVHENPLANCLALPQGDPWAPVALGVLLAGPHRAVQARLPTAKQVLYMDDRSACFRSIQDLDEWLGFWQEFEAVAGRLKTNGSKTQLWGRTKGALQALRDRGDSPSTHMQVLGSSLGQGRRKLTSEEMDRQHKALAVSRRIGVLPVPVKQKQRLCATVVAPRMAWGSLTNGRLPTKQQEDGLFQACTRAVRGSQGPGRAAKPLRSLLVFGHSCSLRVVSLTRATRAVLRWQGARASEGARVGPSDAFLKHRLKILDSCGAPRGEFRPAVAEQALHELRQSWRQAKFVQWLSSSRNDARSARDAGVAYSLKLVDSLRSHASQADGHQVAVMTGGVQTDAHWCQEKPGGLRGFCRDCRTHVTPTTEHVLWDCSLFRDLRVLPKPACALLARLGWNQEGPQAPLIRQLARIRGEAAKQRRLRRLLVV